MEKKYSLWNKGIAQIKEREEKLEEMQQALGEGFTRHKDDEALNEHLKKQLHSEDPMAEYFRVKNHKIQMRTGIVYPTYKGQCPPNRYEIKPGYRWDGVDRSNGFESKMSLEKNKKIAHKELTYRSIAECE
uniref:BUD13 homolog n=1 Tax=Meloidogyne incognita TaxID=6306 RepID=A0A914NG89_MELIC